jgi:putative transposase
MKALKMVIADRTKVKANHKLKNHLDRRSQYCRFNYVSKLNHAGISISITDNGDPYENAMAERVRYP